MYLLYIQVATYKCCLVTFVRKYHSLQKQYSQLMISDPASSFVDENEVDVTTNEIPMDDDVLYLRTESL